MFSFIVILLSSSEAMSVSFSIEESVYKFPTDKSEIVNIAYSSTVTHNYEDIPCNLKIFSRPGVV